ncbi:RNA chaperone Hfq [Microvirga aerilata]|uniref:RNA-binding protein Hfq n=1 Tax=Microvirga aerilata TaxID=670292 RepID=A0A936ZD84_9HYPH|nr:RNA chaperone Hfq [Microvirga aerilata]MBL0407696.1 RNA chaperone Hfq [Microvirga aerilata]
MPAQSTATIQDAFLKHVRANNIDVTMFLVNGIRLQGRIKRYDSYTVQLVRGDSSQIIFKHAISAINPAEPVELMRAKTDQGQSEPVLSPGGSNAG